MAKVKINTGLAAVILLASLFAGWGTLLTVTVLMLLFCEIDEKVKSVAVKVIAFYAGLTLLGMAWDLIVDGIGVVFDSLTGLIGSLNHWCNYTIDISKFQQYFIKPLTGFVNVADGIVNYLLVFAKFGFIVATLSNKAMKTNAITNKINDFVGKVVTYINNIEVQ